MKKIISAIIFIIVILLLCSCSGKVKYTIYSDGSFDGEGSGNNISGKTPSNVEWSSSSKEFFVESRTMLDDIDSSLPKTRVVSMLDDSYSVELIKNYKTGVSEIERYKDKYSQYDMYMGEHLVVEFLHSTDKIVFFSNTNRADRDAKGDCTEQDAISVATSAIKSLYGSEIAAQYEQSEVLSGEGEEKDSYLVVFERKEDVWGIYTEDCIQVRVNLAGKIIAINATFMGVFDTAKDDITEKELNNALNALEKSIKGTWKIAEKKLIIDENGDYYIKAYTLHDGKNTSDFAPPVLYINIQ